VFFISVCCSVAGYSVVSIAGVCVGCVVDLHCCVVLWGVVFILIGCLVLLCGVAILLLYG